MLKPDNFDALHWCWWKHFENITSYDATLIPFTLQKSNCGETPNTRRCTEDKDKDLPCHQTDFNWLITFLRDETPLRRTTRVTSATRQTRESDKDWNETAHALIGCSLIAVSWGLDFSLSLSVRDVQKCFFTWNRVKSFNFAPNAYDKSMLTIFQYEI